LTVAELVLASAVVLLGSVIQGSVGFGLGILAAPLLVLINPVLIPAPLLSAGLVLTLLVAKREHQSIDLHGVTWAVMGRIPGALLGAATLTVLPRRSTTLLVGVIVFIAVAMIGWGPKVRRTRKSLLGAGTISGFMGTTASMGGPPMVVMYRDDSGPRIRGTLSGFFVVGLIISLTTLAFIGRFGRQEMIAALALAPGIVIGFAISNYIAPVIDRGYTRTAVLVVSALAGLSVVLRAALSAP
jgi:uncharacterized membrane protein YfcA